MKSLIQVAATQQPVQLNTNTLPRCLGATTPIRLPSSPPASTRLPVRTCLFFLHPPPQRIAQTRSACAFLDSAFFSNRFFFNLFSGFFFPRQGFVFRALPRTPRRAPRGAAVLHSRDCILNRQRKHAVAFAARPLALSLSRLPHHKRRVKNYQNARFY